MCFPDASRHSLYKCGLPSASTFFAKVEELGVFIIMMSHTTHMLSWSRAYYMDFHFFFSLVEMLRQVKSLLPHCGLLKFYELLISRTNQISKEIPTLPEESFAMEKGSPT